MKIDGNPQNLTNRNGRPKGCKNKFTNLKESFLKAFSEIEKSDETLSDWAKKHKKDFYQMVARMLPTKLEGDLKTNGIIKIEIVKYDGK